MADFPPRDGSGHSPRDFSDDEINDEFAQISRQYLEDSLTGPRDYIAPAEDDEPFVPPDPGPITSADPFLTLGWVLLAGGLLTILLSMMVWPSAPRAFHIGCAAGALTGGAILTWRMPHRRDEDDDEGGAVV